MTNYDDIINLPHHRSTRHPHMSMEERAAQFSPFAALTGYEAVLEESARRTEKQKELTEEEQELLNRSLLQLRRGQLVEITCFWPDERKEGGSYRTEVIEFGKLDPSAGMLVCADGRRIPLVFLVQVQI